MMVRQMGRPLGFELRRGPDIIAYLLYYAFSVSNADRKIALMDEAQTRIDASLMKAR